MTRHVYTAVLRLYAVVTMKWLAAPRGGAVILAHQRSRWAMIGLVQYLPSDSTCLCLLVSSCSGSLSPSQAHLPTSPVAAHAYARPVSSPLCSSLDQSTVKPAQLHLRARSLRRSLSRDEILRTFRRSGIQRRGRRGEHSEIDRQTESHSPLGDQGETNCGVLCSWGLVFWRCISWQITCHCCWVCVFGGCCVAGGELRLWLGCGCFCC
jgi:hypothetical protein